MKSHFDKNDKGDILVQIEKGTTLIDFDYVEMIKQLMVNNKIEVSWGNLEKLEQDKLQELLDKISQAVKVGLEKQL